MEDRERTASLETIGWSVAHSPTLFHLTDCEFVALVFQAFSRAFSLDHLTTNFLIVEVLTNGKYYNFDL